MMISVGWLAVVLPDGHVPTVKSQLLVGVSEATDAEIHGAQEENGQQEKLEPDDPFDTGQVDQGQHNDDESSDAPFNPRIWGFVGRE